MKRLVLLLLIIPVMSQADVIGVADPDTGNCYPFGCSGGSWGPEYQQLYDASLFAAGLNINSISFYNTAYNSGNYDLNSGNYALYLSTTSVTSLSNPFASNVGLDDTLVFSGLLPSNSTPGALGGQFDFLLSSNFIYDPTAGNLLLRVISFDAISNGSIFLDAQSRNGMLSRAYGTSSINNDYGLVTGFNEAARVPEPGVLALLGLGLAGIGFARRRRQS